MYFVVPEEQLAPPVAPIEQPSDRPQGQLQPLPERLSRKESGESRLPAEDVLSELIQALELPAPELTANPLVFLSKQLRFSLPVEDINTPETDIYLIKSVIERIERAQQREQEAVPAAEAQLEKVRDAARRSQYKEAINAAAEIRDADLADGQLRELMGAIWSASVDLSDDSEEELCGYDRVIHIGNILIARNTDDLLLHGRIARALFYKGITLGNLNRSEEAIAVYDEVMHRFGEATEAALREQVAMALQKKHETLVGLGREDEARNVYEELRERFGDISPPQAPT